MNAPRWKQAPPGSHWGEFGPDDQRGRMPPRRYSVLRDGQSDGQQGFCWSYQSEDPAMGRRDPGGRHHARLTSGPPTTPRRPRAPNF